MRKLLFVCLGNICRSPSAEAVFRHFVSQKGESSFFEIDSAGTSDWHQGEAADSRMQVHATRRGYQLTSISRTVNPEVDFDHFDLIVAMDRQNLKDLIAMAPKAEHLKKIVLITDFAKNIPKGVPDPYYGGDKGFEQVLDILEVAAEGLYKSLS